MIPPSIVAENLKRIEQTYEQTKAAIDGKLKPQGYQIIVEKYDSKAFGHRWVDWTNGKDSIRFLWEARDRWFYLKSLRGVPQSWKDDWKDIIYIPFEPQEHDFSYANQIPGRMVTSLRGEE